MEGYLETILFFDLVQFGNENQKTEWSVGVLVIRTQIGSDRFQRILIGIHTVKNRKNRLHYHLNSELSSLTILRRINCLKKNIFSLL